MQIVLVVIVLPFVGLCAVTLIVGLVGVGPRSLPQAVAGSLLLLGAVICAAWGLLRYDEYMHEGVIAAVGVALCVIGLRRVTSRADRMRDLDRARDSG